MAAPPDDSARQVAEPHLSVVGAAVDAYARGEWPEDEESGRRARESVAALRAIVAAEDAVLEDSLTRLHAMQAAVAAAQDSMSAMTAAMAESALLARLSALEGVVTTQGGALERMSTENAWLRGELTTLRSRMQKLEHPGAARGVRHLLVRDGEADAAAGGRTRAPVQWDDDAEVEGEGEGEGEGDAAELAAKLAVREKAVVGAGAGVGDAGAGSGTGS